MSFYWLILSQQKNNFSEPQKLLKQSVPHFHLVFRAILYQDKSIDINKCSPKIFKKDKIFSIAFLYSVQELKKFFQKYIFKSLLNRNIGTLNFAGVGNDKALQHIQINFIPYCGMHQNHSPHTSGSLSSQIVGLHFPASWSSSGHAASIDQRKYEWE